MIYTYIPVRAMMRERGGAASPKIVVKLDIWGIDTYGESVMNI